MIDSHVHFWDPNRLRYPWLDELQGLNKPFGVDDFRKAAGALPHGFSLEGWVFVQCECVFEQGMAELEWVLGLAETEPGFLGVVPWAPVHEGEVVNDYLNALREKSPLIKGVRRLIQSEADPAFCLRPDFVAGVRTLAKHGLSFDLCISHDQLPNIIQLVRQCPEVLFILDHIAKPDIRNQCFEPWRTEIRALAESPNVACKISGLVSEADPQHWTGADLKPYIEHVIDCFGFDRVMFGGDWPVATLATSYSRWVETLAGLVEECSEDEKNKLFHENAHKIYRLHE